MHILSGSSTLYSLGNEHPLCFFVAHALYIAKNSKLDFYTYSDSAASSIKRARDRAYWIVDDILYEFSLGGMRTAKKLLSPPPGRLEYVGNTRISTKKSQLHCIFDLNMEKKCELTSRYNIVHCDEDDVVLNGGEKIELVRYGGDVLWARDFSGGSRVGSIQMLAISDEHSRICLSYNQRGGVYTFYCIDKKNGNLIGELDIHNLARRDSMIIEGNVCYFVDACCAYKVDIVSGLLISKIKFDAASEIKAACDTEKYICLLYQKDAELIVLEKSTFVVLHRLELGGDSHQGVALAGNRFGIAAKLQPNAAQRQDEAAYGIFLSEQELSGGSLPDLTPEPLKASVEKLGEKNSYQLLIKLDSNLTFSDFLRHASFALWNFAFEYSHYINPFDPNESRAGDPFFSGQIILDVSGYKLEEDHGAAFDAVINNARQIMCGAGPTKGCLWAGTQNGTNVSIEVRR